MNERGITTKVIHLFPNYEKPKVLKMLDSGQFPVISVRRLCRLCNLDFQLRMGENKGCYKHKRRPAPLALEIRGSGPDFVRIGDKVFPLKEYKFKPRVSKTPGRVPFTIRPKYPMSTYCKYAPPILNEATIVRQEILDSLSAMSDSTLFCPHCITLRDKSRYQRISRWDSCPDLTVDTKFETRKAQHNKSHSCAMAQQPEHFQNKETYVLPKGGIVHFPSVCFGHQGTAILDSGCCDTLIPMELWRTKYPQSPRPPMVKLLNYKGQESLMYGPMEATIDTQFGRWIGMVFLTNQSIKDSIILGLSFM